MIDVSNVYTHMIKSATKTEGWSTQPSVIFGLRLWVRVYECFQGTHVPPQSATYRLGAITKRLPASTALQLQRFQSSVELWWSEMVAGTPIFVLRQSIQHRAEH